MEFDRLPLNDAPLLPFTLLVYTAYQVSNPQLFNSCLQRAKTHIDCMPLWKGDILLLKYDREEQLLADVSYADVSLCHALLQIAIFRGQLGKHLPVAVALPLANMRRQSLVCTSHY